jgi:16S rRNA (uracil1498-N3)-methyltransferase
MYQFYAADLSGSHLQLDEDESKHLVRVLRLNNGDHVQFVDGRGLRADVVIRDNHPKRCLLEIIERNNELTGRSFHLHLAIAPTKNMERMEWLFEKLTEVGIDTLTLIQCEHSERVTVRMDRLEKIAIAAMKQSQQSWLPVMQEPIPFSEFIAVKTSPSLQLYIAHCADDKMKVSVFDTLHKNKDVLILIGPEGDFSLNEIQQAKNNGFQAISLGSTRLRTETAGFFACCSVHAINNQ